MCARSLLLQTPQNYIILGAFTVAESFLLNEYLFQFNTELIMTAFIMTGLVVAIMGYVALNTKTEFLTSKNVFYILLGHMIFSLVSLFFFSINNVVYSFLGGVVACIYLVIDI